MMLDSAGKLSLTEFQKLGIRYVQSTKPTAGMRLSDLWLNRSTGLISYWNGSGFVVNQPILGTSLSSANRTASFTAEIAMTTFNSGTLLTNLSFYGNLASGTLDASNDWLVSLDARFYSIGQSGLTTVNLLTNQSFFANGVAANGNLQRLILPLNYASVDPVYSFFLTVTKLGAAPNILGSATLSNRFILNGLVML